MVGPCSVSACNTVPVSPKRVDALVAGFLVIKALDKFGNTVPTPSAGTAAAASRLRFPAPRHESSAVFSVASCPNTSVGDYVRISKAQSSAKSGEGIQPQTPLLMSPTLIFYALCRTLTSHGRRPPTPQGTS